MTLGYNVVIRNVKGVPIANIQRWDTLDLNRKINDVGSMVMTFRGAQESLFSTLTEDSLVEVYRGDPPNLPYYLEWEGFYRDQRRSVTGDGTKLFEITAVTYDDLLDRRIIAYHASTAYAFKNGIASDVIYAYVDENLGENATCPPRIYDGVCPNFAVATTDSFGGLWVGDVAYKNLLDVCKDIALFGGIDFGIINASPGTGMPSFELQMWDVQRGDNRSKVIVDPKTGLNYYGFIPIVFDFNLNTMVDSEYYFKTSGEANIVYVLGGGQKTDRTVLVRSNLSRTIASPWNQTEITRTAGRENDTSALQATGDVALLENLYEENIEFQVLQYPTLMYGKHYFLGDIISARFDEKFIIKKINGVSISVPATGGMEQITMEFVNA